MKKFKPEGQLISTEENKKRVSSAGALHDAFYSGAPVECRVLRCDAEHNLHVDLGCMKGIIPRCEGALGIEDGSVRDIALISRVNKPVVCAVTGFASTPEGENYALLSRRKVQQECADEYISTLRPGDVIPATVSHIEGFGVFCDIGAGINALMPIDGISVSRIPHPSARFTAGQSIYAVVKSVDSDGRITLSHKELLGTWEQNISKLKVGETVPGIVRSVEKYGIFVELAPNLAGLAEPCDFLFEGQRVAVYIKSVLPDKMKIKLVIVEAFEESEPAGELKYFFTGEHMARFDYSPENSAKIISTVFEE